MQNFFIFLGHHWLLVGLFVILVAALLWLETQGKVAGMARVTPQVAINKINREDAVVFDIRDKGLFNKGHIANAQHLAADAIENKDLAKYNDVPVIFVCANGVSAAKLGARLKKKGLNHTFFLQGGIAAWQTANLPLVKK